jgi:pimeloyl-ACP methyl ester carboxylesterase
MLLVVGRDDYYRADMEWLAECAPDATLHVMDDVGHCPFIEAADDFTTRVAGFLNRTGRLIGDD